MGFARILVLRVIVLSLLLAIAACTGAAPTPTPLPDPVTMLNKAAAEVQDAKSVKIKLQLTGAPSYVDPPGNKIAFISADGFYTTPDRVSATVVASILGIPGKVDVIAIGDDQWMRNEILTAGRWIKQIFSPGFNAGKLISSAEGIQAALKAFKNVKLVGQENVDGTQMHHITGTAAGADIASLTVGLIRGSDVLVDIYIPVDTGRVDRVIMVQPDTVTTKDPKPTTWTLELYDYNTEAQITPPSVESGTAAATAAQGETTRATSVATTAAPQPTSEPPTAQGTQSQ